MWGIWNPCALLVRISNRAATVENSIIVSQKIKQSILIWSSNSTSGYTPKRIERRDSKRYLYTHVHSSITVSPLHTNFQVANFQRCERAFHQRPAWVKLQLALRLLLLTILQLYHLPPPLPPPVSNSSCLFTRCQPLYASCCTVLLYFSRYCTVRIKNVFFIFCVCFFCIICVKTIINLLSTVLYNQLC